MFYDQQDGLYLTYFRAYDPAIGRWLSRDPLKNTERREGSNLYEYGLNDPINNTDPMGLAVGDWYDPSTYATSAFWQGFSDPNARQQSAAAAIDGLLTLDGFLGNGPFNIQCGNQYNQNVSMMLGGIGDLGVLGSGVAVGETVYAYPYVAAGVSASALLMVPLIYESMGESTPSGPNESIANPPSQPLQPDDYEEP
jgi:RHS repeat-associated protein